MAEPNVGTARLRITIDGRDIEHGVGQAVDRAQPGVVGKFGGMAKAAVGAFAGAFAVGKLAEFGGQLVGLSTTVETFRNKAATVFEQSNEDVRRWADDNASAFGITDDQLAGLAANFGDLLKPMGFTAAQAAGMSKDVVGLAGALSAWSGGQRSAAEVSQILADAMLGERDALKSLGISISEADVQAKLAAKGQKDLTGSALEQAKAIATQELIFAKSTDAQKAWADGTFAGVKAQNALREKLAELKEGLAGVLTPAFSAATRVLVDKFVPALAKIAETVRPVVNTVVGAFRQIGAVLLARDFVGGGPFAEDSPFMDGLFKFRDFVTERALPALRQLGGFIQENLRPVLLAVGTIVAAVVVPPFVAWAVATVAAVAPFLALGAAVLGLIALVKRFPIIAEIVGNVLGTVGDLFAGVVDYVKTIWPQISEAVGHVFAVIGTIVDTNLAAIKLIWKTWGDEVFAVVKVVWDTIRNIVDAGLKVIRGVIQTLLAVINGDWGKAWDGLKGIVSGLFDAVKAIIGGAAGILGQAFEGLMSAVRVVWDTGWAGFKAVAVGIWDAIVDAARRALGWIGNGLERLVNNGVAAINLLISAYNALPLDNIDKLGKIEIDWGLPAVPTVPPGTFERGGPANSFPDITAAKGGFITAAFGQPVPIVAHGQEVIQPLDEFYRTLERARRSSEDAFADGNRDGVGQPVSITQQFYGAHDAATAQDRAIEKVRKLRLLGVL